MKKILNLIKYWLKLVPSWKDCKYASCWDGGNAQRRMMNILSPNFTDTKFKDYMEWMKSRGCNTAHVILMNNHDGEGAGYTALDNPSLTKSRIKKLFTNGFAIVPWIITDDSSVYAKWLFSDPEKYIKSFKDIGVFDYASYVVAGLEMDEYGNASQWSSVIAAIKKYCPGMKIGVHHTSGKYTFAGLGDIVLDQLDPSNANKTTITNSINKIKALGNEAVGFEYSRHASRDLANYALNAGAFSVGNW